MVITVVRGRAFTETDNQERDPVILINQAMADTYRPDGDALGQRFKSGRSTRSQRPTARPGSGAAHRTQPTVRRRAAFLSSGHSLDSSSR